MGFVFVLITVPKGVGQKQWSRTVCFLPSFKNLKESSLRSSVLSYHSPIENDSVSKNFWNCISLEKNHFEIVFAILVFSRKSSILTVQMSRKNVLEFRFLNVFPWIKKYLLILFFLHWFSLIKSVNHNRFDQLYDRIFLLKTLPNQCDVWVFWNH